MKPVTDRTDWSGTIATAPSTAFVDASLINSTQTELENAVLASGQTLDEANNYQLARSITDHALGGRYSVDTGTVNNYILSITGSRYAPTTLVAGYVLEFFTGNANTITTPTLNYTTLGVKTIVAENGTDAILAGDIKVGVLNKVIYDGTNWRLILPKVPNASQTVAGIIKISTTALVNGGIDNLTAITPLQLKTKMEEVRKNTVWHNERDFTETEYDYAGNIILVRKSMAATRIIGTNGSIIFNTAFPTACYNVQISLEFGGATGSQLYWNTPSPTGFNFGWSAFNSVGNGNSCIINIIATGK